MQIDIFAEPAEFAAIVEFACMELEASLYALCPREVHPVLIGSSEALGYAERGCSLLISPSDLTAERADLLMREDLVSTVAVRFGRADDLRIESSSFTADGSVFGKQFASKVRAFLRKQYLSDLVNVETGEPRLSGIKFFYSNAAARSGKMFSQFLEQRTVYRPARGSLG